MHDRVEQLFEELAGRDVGCREALKDAAHRVVDELLNYGCSESDIEEIVGDLYLTFSSCQDALARKD